MTTQRTLRTPAQLCEHGLVSAEQLPALEAVAARYAVAVSPALVALIDRDDARDHAAGLRHRAGFRTAGDAGVRRRAYRAGDLDPGSGIAILRGVE